LFYSHNEVDVFVWDIRGVCRVEEVVKK
jgi:hypothetical protein